MRRDSENFLLSSDYDFETARHMFRKGRYVYVVFMCHIAIEKLLKAIVAEVVEKSPPKTHNLLYLIKEAGLKIPQHLFDFVAKINNTSIATRYLEDFRELLASYPKNVTKNYLRSAEEVLKWLRQNVRLIQ